MKKISLLLATSTLLLVPMVATPIAINGVYATDNETTETIDNNEVVENEEKKENSDWFKEFFTAERVALIMTCVGYIATMLGLVAKIKSLAKEKNLTTENVKNAVLDSLDDNIKKEITPYLETLDKGVKSVKEVLEIFAKILALSQDKSNESKLAILELIEKLGTIDSLVEETKTKVVNDIKEKEEKKAETLEQVEQVIENTDNGVQI